MPTDLHTTDTIQKFADGRFSPSFSLKNRIARWIWGFAWLVLIRPSPRPLHSWRAIVFRFFGAKLGDNVHIYPSARVWAPWNLSIGTNSCIADGATVYNIAAISISEDVVISQDAYLCTGSHDIGSSNFQLVAESISIERSAWVCARAFIGPGVTVPCGCVVGAQSVLMRTIDEPWSVWLGNPALRVKARIIRKE